MGGGGGSGPGSRVEQVVARPAAGHDVRGVKDPLGREAEALGLLRHDVVDGELQLGVESTQEVLGQLGPRESVRSPLVLGPRLCGRHEPIPAAAVTARLCGEVRARDEPTGVEASRRHVGGHKQDKEIRSRPHRLASNVGREAARSEALRVAHPRLHLDGQRGAPAAAMEDEVDAFVVDQRRSRR